MLVVSDEQLKEAAKKLSSAGFLDSPWSFGGKEPEFYQGKGPIFENVFHSNNKGWRDLDQHSTRFLFPPTIETRAKVALIPSSYALLDLSTLPNEHFQRERNISYPDAQTLLRSFAKTVVRIPSDSYFWISSLSSWSLTSLYGDLMLDDDLLDDCGDEEAIAWFNEGIYRYSGGMDRTTVTKRLGKVARVSE